MGEGLTGTVKIVSSLGLGVAIAWIAFHHLMDADRRNDEWMKAYNDRLIKATEARAAAETETAAALREFAGAVKGNAAKYDRVIEEFDDLSDGCRGLCKRIDRMLPYVTPPEDKK